MGGQYNEQQVQKAVTRNMNELQAVHETSTAYCNADGTVCVTSANGSIIVIDPSETN